MRRASFVRTTAFAAGAAALILAGCGSGGTQSGRDDASPGDGNSDAGTGDVVLYSTQFNPVEEADAIRRDVIDAFDGEAEFVGAASEGEFIDRVSAESQAGQGDVSLLGALHGTYVDLQEQGLLMDLSDLTDEFAAAGVSEDLLELGTLGTDQQWYIPWVQASYVVAVNKEALDYLPDGADVESLTYDEYLQWAQNTAEAVGTPRFGFPAGEEGLMHRFLQGYLVPSFSGGTVTTFPDPAAWEYLADLWQYVHPQSLTYEFMEDPLLSGEVLVAWDHVARLKTALDNRPDDFIVVPAPSGPEGRAHMPVVAGLAIPASSPNPDGAKELIRHLLSEESQLATLSAVAFYPVIEVGDTGELDPGVQLSAAAVDQQTNADDALLVLLPIGLGDQGGTFNDIYRAAFERVAVNGEDAAGALDAEAPRLEQVMQDTGAPCWAPDEVSDGPCPVGS